GRSRHIHDRARLTGELTAGAGTSLDAAIIWSGVASPVGSGSGFGARVRNGLRARRGERAKAAAANGEDGIMRHARAAGACSFEGAAIRTRDARRVGKGRSRV